MEIHALTFLDVSVVGRWDLSHLRYLALSQCSRCKEKHHDGFGGAGGHMNRVET
jgi:hypothetical protein